MQPELLKKLEQIRNLPTLPEIITKLRKTVRDPRTDAAKVARIIEDDPAMMARILKLVNSVFYAGLEPITSIKHAVARIGFNAVINAALSTSVFSTFGRKGQSDFDRVAFWRHSISTGIAAVVLHDRAAPALDRRYSRDVLHLAGLVHDIGKIIFEQFFHAEFLAALRRSEETRCPLFAAEPATLETDHMEVGAWLGAKWNLTPEVVNVIRWHHAPGEGDPAHASIAWITHAANFVCNQEKMGNSGDSAAPAFIEAGWQRLGLAPGDVPAIVEQIREESKKSEVLLSFM